MPLSRFLRWADFSRRALELLTRPRIDPAGSDHAVEVLARESRLGCALDGALGLFGHAWTSSFTCAAIGKLSAMLTAESSTETLRLRGLVIVIAAITAAALDAVKPVPVGPLSALVPSLVIAAGALTMLLAAPLARAAADRRVRSARRPVQGRHDKVS